MIDNSAFRLASRLTMCGGIRSKYEVPQRMKMLCSSSVLTHAQPSCRVPSSISAKMTATSWVAMLCTCNSSTW